LINKYNNASQRNICIEIIRNLIIIAYKKIMASRRDIIVNTNDNSLKLLRRYDIIATSAIRPNLFLNKIHKRGNAYEYIFFLYK